MIASNKRTSAGSVGVLRTNSYVCCVSTLPGFFRGTIAIFKANANGEIVKWPPVGKAYLGRGTTRQQRNEIHDYVLGLLDDVGDNGAGQTSLGSAMEGVFQVAKAQGIITKYITNAAF